MIVIVATIEDRSQLPPNSLYLLLSHWTGKYSSKRDLYLDIMRVSDRSRRNEAILSYSPDDRSLLFRANNDWMTSILSYLSIKSICSTDIAVTNTAARVIWLWSLHVTTHDTINDYQHCPRSIRWLIERGVRLESLTVGDGQWDTSRLNGITLIGLNKSLLRYVSFGKCNIGDAEVLSLAHNCPDLTEISLDGCNGITDASVITLAKSCRQLLSINIGGCINITDEGLLAFGRAISCACPNERDGNLVDRLHFTNLEIISLYGCANITDVGVSAIVCCCPLLRTFVLHGCVKITDVGVLAVAQKCPRLSSIDLSWCGMITDIGVSAIADKCPQLKKIFLLECKKITYTGVSAVVNKCLSLLHLDITCCSRISPYYLSDLRRDNPCLHIFR